MQRQPGQVRQPLLPLVTLGVCCLLILFFRADELLGAAGLHAWYTPLSWIASTCLLAGIFVLLISWQERPKHILAMAAIIILCWLIAFTAAWVFVGWIAALVDNFLMVPVTIVSLIGILVVLVIWIACRLEFLDSGGYRLTPIAVCALLFAAFFIFGIGAFPKNSESDSRGDISLRDHHYHLALYWGWLGDPDTLILYQCNLLGLSCEKVYQTTHSDYRQQNIALAADSTANKIIVSVNGEPVKTYQP